VSAVVHFQLAPMSLGLRLLTYGLFVIPAFQIAVGMVVPRPLALVFLGVAALVLLSFASVPLFFRPTAFEVEGHLLTIRWLTRTRSIDLRGAEVSIISRADLNREYGFGYRIGAGGLGGAFGLYKTGKETFGLWVSTLDAWVLLRPREGRALLVTPEHPERFVDVVSRARER
jgi:hypothetical protein